MPAEALTKFQVALDDETFWDIEADFFEVSEHDPPTLEFFLENDVEYVLIAAVKNWKRVYHINV